MSRTELKSSHPNSNSPLSYPAKAESANPLEGPSIKQMIEKMQKEKLTPITIYSSVTSIGKGAFYKCSSLTQITIPSSVRSIRFNVFDGCTKLYSQDQFECTRITLMNRPDFWDLWN